MRAIFEKNKQKEFLRINKGNITWQEYADNLNVKKGTLLCWYNEKNTLPLDIYDKILKHKPRDNTVLIVENNWGKRKGGSNSKGNTKRINMPKKSESLAEFIGIVLGDGNVHSYRKAMKSSYMIRIAGDFVKDKQYLEKYVKDLIRDLFLIEPKTYVQPDKNERFIIIHSKEAVNFMENHGILPGNKIKIGSRIPFWIRQNNNYMRACLRGLIDTDGSIFRMSRKDPQLLRIGFRCYSDLLIRDAWTGFYSLGFFPSQINNNQFFLSRKRDIEKYIKEIGFSNQKHLSRLDGFRQPRSVVANSCLSLG